METRQRSFAVDAFFLGQFQKVRLIGCGAILNGHPKLLPMVLESVGRWTGETP